MLSFLYTSWRYKLIRGRGREREGISFILQRRLIDSYSHHYHRCRSSLNTLITESLQLVRHNICIKQNQFNYSMMHQPKILIRMQIVVEVYLFKNVFFFFFFSSLFEYDLRYLSIDTIVNIKQSCCCFVQENRKPRFSSFFCSYRSFNRKNV